MFAAASELVQIPLKGRLDDLILKYPTRGCGDRHLADDVRQQGEGFVFALDGLLIVGITPSSAPCRSYLRGQRTEVLRERTLDDGIFVATKGSCGDGEPARQV